MKAQIVLLCLAAFPFAKAAADGEPFTFIAPTNLTMPLAQFTGEQLTGGIVKDIGDVIAERLGYSARYRSIPPKRVGKTLSSGEADAACYLLPDWVKGDFNWSPPLIPDGDLVVSRADAPKIDKLADLIGHRVGTVLGYPYPSVAAVIGSQFERDDALSAELNLRKLVMGRTEHAFVEKSSLDYELKLRPDSKVRIDLVIDSYSAKCAFSKHGKVPLDQLQAAIASLIKDGSIERILSNYR
jgi:ABC-type amino acid transport substrate-binding protein